MHSNKHAYTILNDPSFFPWSLAPPPLNLTVVKWFDYNPLEGLTMAWKPSYPTAYLGVGLGIGEGRWGGSWKGGVVGSHWWGWVYLESSDPESGAETPGSLEDEIFQKEALVTFQIVHCYVFILLGKKLSAPTSFFAEFTRHDRLHLQCNKMLNSIDTFTKIFVAHHSLCYLSGMNRQSSLMGPVGWTEHLESSSCYFYSLQLPLSISSFPISNPPHRCTQSIPYRVYV